MLVGGHSPINTAYASNINLDSIGLANYESRDPSFEIYTPPYAMRDDRPVITNAPSEMTTNGRDFDISVSGGTIDQVMLIRRTATTHLVDGDQRAVKLPIVARDDGQITLAMTANPAVLPAGQYMLFASTVADDGMRVPSESVPVTILPRSDGAPVIQPVPAVVATDEPGLLGQTLGLVGQLGTLGQDETVSPLLPLTDLLSGVTSIIPDSDTLISGAPATADAPPTTPVEPV